MHLQVLDIGHSVYRAIVEPDNAFWALVRNDEAEEALADDSVPSLCRDAVAAMSAEMEALRFRQQPSAVYFNPTERCNLGCPYCYLPAEMRRNGEHMPEGRMLDALGRLRAYFRRALPAGVRPQVVFHGAEPLLNRGALFAAIEAFRDDFLFGVQTNATLLDDAAIEFLTSREVSIGLSLDGPTAEIADRTRREWSGKGVFDSTQRAIGRLEGCPSYSVICTVTTENVPTLVRLVDLLHSWAVPACMLNPVRCTQPGARHLKPSDDAIVQHYLAALDRARDLYHDTGRRLIIANFANILLAILAPTARRLMCDISPCGGGRCFFALAANGDLFPCSEFIGLPEFRGGNLFEGGVEEALRSRAFRRVTGRKVEDIAGCATCPVRHFCGAPCPAEAHALNGRESGRGAFCELFVEQAKYAFRQIADGEERSFLWDGWDEGLTTTLASRGSARPPARDPRPYRTRPWGG